ncbi:MAG: 4-hydroxybenzoate synthetase [Gammaproteobacteria bacterium]|nr:4-hydroxybenzoate synthetase [Gammaproteobacteria bacterium]|tara:strand:+ start:4224 stop:4829 length:606 start_codon:yes stop_codon:yes gene_type:complete
MNTQQALGPIAAFDPVDSVFVAQDNRPPDFLQVDTYSLTPFQRALLVTDGTVTKFLEAYAYEPILVDRLNQETGGLDIDHEWLAATAGDRVIHREVALIGEHSENLYAYARAIILVGRLNDSMYQGVEAASGGLGKILLDSEIESRRECLWWGVEKPEATPDAISSKCDGNFLTRTYRIIADQAPLMLITERFPMSNNTEQ